MSFHLYDTDTKDFTEIYQAKELSKKVYDTVKFYQDRADNLIKANQVLIDNARTYVDEQLKKENDELKRRLSLCIVELASDKELAAYNAFSKKHQDCRSNAKTFLGMMPFVIQNNVGVGNISKVKCPICGDTEDITDTGVW